MRLEKEFNQYLANLAIWTAKLHNLHWNVQGDAFVPVHEFTEVMYNKTFADMDLVAEHFRMYDIIPVSTMEEYLKIATIKEIPGRIYSDKEVLEILLDDIKLMEKEAMYLRNESDKEGWFAAVSMFEEMISFYKKNIWFIKSTLYK